MGTGQTGNHLKRVEFDLGAFAGGVESIPSRDWTNFYQELQMELGLGGIALQLPIVHRRSNQSRALVEQK
jgi:hypothetical protein